MGQKQASKGQVDLKATDPTDMALDISKAQLGTNHRRESQAL